MPHYCPTHDIHFPGRRCRRCWEEDSGGLKAHAGVPYAEPREPMQELHRDAEFLLLDALIFAGYGLVKQEYITEADIDDAWERWQVAGFPRTGHGPGVQEEVRVLWEVRKREAGRDCA